LWYFHIAASHWLWLGAGRSWSDNLLSNHKFTAWAWLDLAWKLKVDVFSL
jgi:hypothetical protein